MMEYTFKAITIQIVGTFVSFQGTVQSIPQLIICNMSKWNKTCFRMTVTIEKVETT